MMTTAALSPSPAVSEADYKRRIWAWTMYDWANSAFVTTIMAAVLPVYFSQVAGATLASPTLATAYWSTGLSISLLIVAVLSPILGTVSDVMRGKKLFLSLFCGVGVVSSALLVFVGTGDWLLASLLAILGRIGLNGSITFYDSLLPHVARPEDQDSVSARGYAMGYLGGGLLLAINIVMILLLPGTWGARLSFLSVAIWWAVFTIPLLRTVPEPQTAALALGAQESVIRASFARMADTIRHIRRYRELFKYLVAYLIYNDGIGTIIGVAAIYGAEMHFADVDLMLALLLVQFVAIPYALIFGRLPDAQERRRPFFLAFMFFNVIALLLLGVFGARLLPRSLSGARPGSFPAQAGFAGQGLYLADVPELQLSGSWQLDRIPPDVTGLEQDLAIQNSLDPAAAYEFSYNGQSVKLTYSVGPDHGLWAVLLDGQAVIDPDTLKPLQIDAYNPTLRYESTTTLRAEAPGQHTVRVQTAGAAPDSQGQRLSLSSIEVLPPERERSLLVVLGLIVASVAVSLGLAWLAKGFFAGAARRIDTKTGILVGLAIYGVIAMWGYFIDSVIEFWCLAWMVAVVQGGSQALSRSLYAAMTPAAKSGEFFGLFGIMEKFSSIIGPVLFAVAGVMLGSSRPAVLSLVIFFIVGGYLLAKVNVEEGKRAALLDEAASQPGA
ncbi:MAG: MFS transporter [Chloroflexota bacterium]